MKHVQVTIDQDTLTEVDRIGKSLGLMRSEILRRALRDWVRRHAVKRFEREWITALKTTSDEAQGADDWRAIQTWTKQ